MRDQQNDRDTIPSRPDPDKQDPRTERRPSHPSSRPDLRAKAMQPRARTRPREIATAVVLAVMWGVLIVVAPTSQLAAGVTLAVVGVIVAGYISRRIKHRRWAVRVHAMAHAAVSGARRTPRDWTPDELRTLGLRCICNPDDPACPVHYPTPGVPRAWTDDELRRLGAGRYLDDTRADYNAATGGRDLDADLRGVDTINTVDPLGPSTGRWPNAESEHGVVDEDGDDRLSTTTRHATDHKTEMTVDELADEITGTSDETLCKCGHPRDQHTCRGHLGSCLATELLPHSTGGGEAECSCTEFEYAPRDDAIDRYLAERLTQDLIGNAKGELQ